MSPAQPRYRRVMVKLSGEALMGSQPFGIEPAVVRRGELTALYVVAPDGRIGLRQVRLGERHDALRTVLAGLSAGERVAVDPVAAADRQNGGSSVLFH